MSVVEVNLETGEMLRHFGAFSDRVQGGLGPDWAGPAISFELATIEREWFESRGAGTWPPLAPSTIVARTNRVGHYALSPLAGVGPVGPVLMWTGRLFFSLADPHGRGSIDAMVRMSDTELEQGTIVPYAKYHSGPGAARQVMKPLGTRDINRLRGVFAEYVLEAMDS